MHALSNAGPSTAKLSTANASIAGPAAAGRSQASLSNTSRIIATDLRHAERSINSAMRDTAQFLLTTLDATDTHRLSPAMMQRTVKAAIDALTGLVEGQQQMAMRAHPAIEKAGQALGLTVTDWGVGDPKPGIDADVPTLALD